MNVLDRVTQVEMCTFLCHCLKLKCILCCKLCTKAMTNLHVHNLNQECTSYKSSPMYLSLSGNTMSLSTLCFVCQNICAIRGCKCMRLGGKLTVTMYSQQYCFSSTACTMSTSSSYRKLRAHKSFFAFGLLLSSVQRGSPLFCKSNNCMEYHCYLPIFFG